MTMLDQNAHLLGTKYQVWLESNTRYLITAVWFTTDASTFITPGRITSGPRRYYHHRFDFLFSRRSATGFGLQFWIYKHLHVLSDRMRRWPNDHTLNFASLTRFRLCYNLLNTYWGASLVGCFRYTQFCQFLHSVCYDWWRMSVSSARREIFGNTLGSWTIAM